MRFKLFILLLSVVMLYNCKNSEKQRDKNEPLTEEVLLSDLKLDNGKKWIANLETEIGVKNMDSIIKVFKQENNTDYASLGEALSKQTSYVIKNCSMKGEPHDQLHVVLVPMLDEISAMKEGGNGKNLDELTALINAYFKHFKVEQ